VTLPPAFGPEVVQRGEVLARGLSVRFPHRGASAVIRIQPVRTQPAAPLPGVQELTSAPLPDGTPGGEKTLRLNWAAVAGADRYVVSLAEKGQPLRPLDGSFIPTYLLSGLRPDVSYSVQVSAESIDGTASRTSPPLTVSLPAPTSPPDK
jgi:hypothetical protein